MLQISKVISTTFPNDIYIAEYFQYTLETADDITQYYFALRDRWYGTFYSLKDVICTTRGESGI